MATQKSNQIVCSICNLNQIPQSRITYPNEACLCNYCSMIAFGKKGVDYDGAETEVLEINELTDKV